MNITVYGGDVDVVCDSKITKATKVKDSFVDDITEFSYYN